MSASPNPVLIKAYLKSLLKSLEEKKAAEKPKPSSYEEHDGHFKNHEGEQ